MLSSLLRTVDGLRAIWPWCRTEKKRTAVSVQIGTDGESRKRKTTPRLNVNVEVLDYDVCQREQPFADIELREVDGRLALVGDVLGDEMRGWALVRMADDKASSQKVVTRCRLYEQYLTEEAFDRAAQSYGGLTKSALLTPDED